MQVGEGVIIDGSKLGLNGGQLVGVVKHIISGGYITHLPRRVEQDMILEGYAYQMVYPSDITATLPNQGHWLGKEMP